jgi:enoyl-CoA hydratase
MTQPASAPAANQPDILLSEQGRAGFITLNRPQALNALTHGMIKSLEAFRHQCAKNPRLYGIVMEGPGRAFCAGGDLHAIYNHGRTEPAKIEQFYADEYQHNWTLECFTKPHVALIEGIVMGGGVGTSLYGTHRVAGENIRFAMPETGIGFFTDIGASWFLPRLPSKTGIYLGLTGAVISQADCYYCGLVTHCIPADKFAIVKDAMAEAEPIDAVLDSLHNDPAQPSRLKILQAVIARVFDAPTLEEIFVRLEAEKGEYEDWAAQTLDTLSKRSPLSLKVTLALLQKGAHHKSLKDALVTEFRLTRQFLRQPDLYEGIRAALIEKGSEPQWRPNSLKEVSDEMVQSLFSKNGEDLQLKDYWQLVE